MGIGKGASRSEIKKAYHKVRHSRQRCADLISLKAALASHPDKVAESDRSTADVKFKSISQAYEILSDDDKRHLYDTHGMAAFDSSRGSGMEGMDVNDILQEMFGMSGMGDRSRGSGGGSKKPRKGKDEEQNYEVTLEELYKGKSVKFASTKNIICTHCKGKGGKDHAVPKKCDSCSGRGRIVPLFT